MELLTLRRSFASREEAKPPNILATVVDSIKAKVARSPATKKRKAPLLSKRSHPFHLRFFFLNPGTFSKNAFFFLPLPSFSWLASGRGCRSSSLTFATTVKFSTCATFSAARSLLRSLRPPPRFFLPVLAVQSRLDDL